MKTKYHPFFCHKKGCRKSIKDTPEYLNDEIDIKILRKIHHYLFMDDRLGFNDYLREFTGNKTESNFKETVSELFFNRVVAWPEGKRYYFEASERLQIDIFNGFKRDYTNSIVTFLQDNS